MDSPETTTIGGIARIGALIGEPARTTMLVELMDGRALTAGELARAARVVPATASAHPARLVDGGLLRATARGRHRYYTLASIEVARLLETVMQFAGAGPLRTPRVVAGARDAALRTARTCYDHLAGRLGVAIADHLVEAGSVSISEDGARLTRQGHRELAQIGLDGFDVEPSDRARDLALRPCMDWTERRPHFGGRVAAALCAHCMTRARVVRRSDARALHIAPAGQVMLRDWLGPRRLAWVLDGGPVAVAPHPIRAAARAARGPRAAYGVLDPRT